MSKPNKTEPNVDVDELEKSAALLLASVNTMKKGGFNMETGEHIDEGGTRGGNMPGDGDAGGVDDLMIGKATKALKAAGFSPKMIGRMVAMMKKGDDEDDEDGDGDGDDDKDDPAYARKSAAAFAKSAKKLLAEYKADPDVAEALASDAGPAIGGMLSVTSEALARVQGSQRAFAKSQIGFNERLAPAIAQIGREIRVLQKSHKLIMEKLNIVERAPVAPAKSTSTEPMNKGGGNTAPNPAAPPTLTRDQLTGTLSYMAMVKGERVVGNTDLLTKSALIAGGGSADVETVHIATSWLLNNPAERALALSFNSR